MALPGDAGSVGQCHPWGGVPVVTPRPPQDVGLLELLSRREEATPYTFYKTFGGSTHTFEAAAFPGHFLSTAPGHGQPLALAPPPAATAFYLRRTGPNAPRGRVTPLGGGVPPTGAR